MEKDYNSTLSVKRCTRIAVIQTVYAGLFLQKQHDLEYMESLSGDIITECQTSFGPLDRRLYKKFLQHTHGHIDEIANIVQQSNSSNKTQLDMLIQSILYPGIAEMMFTPNPLPSQTDH